MLQNFGDWETQILLVACFYDVLQPQLMSFYIPQKLEQLSQFYLRRFEYKKSQCYKLNGPVIPFLHLTHIKEQYFCKQLFEFYNIFVAFCDNYFEINETFSTCQTFQYFLKKGPKRIGEVFLSHFVIKTVIKKNFDSIQI